jgi:hypothetical protein
MSSKASQSAMSALQCDLDSKNEEIGKLQLLVNKASPIQHRLEEQLRSAQQLVRGSLQQHERYETQAELHLKEIAKLRKENERLEAEIALNKKEQVETAGTGAQTLEELVEFERRRFKKALADEKARASEILEKERAQFERSLRESRLEASRQLELALSESLASKEEKRAMSRDNQMQLERFEALRNSIQNEKQTAVSVFRDLKQEIQRVKKQVITMNLDAEFPSASMPLDASMPPASATPSLADWRPDQQPAARPTSGWRQDQEPGVTRRLEVSGDLASRDELRRYDSPGSRGYAGDGPSRDELRRVGGDPLPARRDSQPQPRSDYVGREAGLHLELQAAERVIEKLRLEKAAMSQELGGFGMRAGPAQGSPRHGRRMGGDAPDLRAEAAASRPREREPRPRRPGAER